MPEGTVLRFINNHPLKKTGRLLLFEDPVSIVSCQNSNAVPQALLDLDTAREQGYHTAGYFSYESSGSIHETGNITSKMPLVWMGLYEKFRLVEENEFETIFNQLAQKFDTGDFELKTNPNDDGMFDFHTRVESSKSRHAQLIAQKKIFLDSLYKIKKKLVAGECYQVNFTMNQHWSFSGNPVKLFAFLYDLQPTIQSALVLHSKRAILSHSPETFFTLKKSASDFTISSYPMKGTIQRSVDAHIDQENKQILQADEKTKAENLMITDLMRNDLGHIAKHSSVITKKLFAIKSYPTLHQMISVIQATLDPQNLKHFFSQSFMHLFPPASITGAPKLAVQKIIQALENEPRGVYTGSIGYMLSPLNPSIEQVIQKNQIAYADFNVAIRTIDIDLEQNLAQYGSGCGIVYDSIPEDEWGEYLLKASFMQPAFSGFHLIETLLLKNGLIKMEKKHLLRIQSSAREILKKKSHELKVDLIELQDRLDHYKKKFPKSTHKIRIAYYRTGIQSQIQEYTPALKKPVIGISRFSLDESNPFSHHKTSHRIVYDNAWLEAQKAGLSDMVLLNQKGQVVECTTNNIIILTRNSQWKTPPPNSGLLNGIGLQSLMEKHTKIRFETLYPTDLEKARAVFIINSVQGFRRVQIQF